MVSRNIKHYIKNRNFIISFVNQLQFHFVIFWCWNFVESFLKVSAKFQTTCAKLSGNYAFPQNFYTSRLYEITVLYYAKYPNFTKFPGVEILRKGTVTTEFRAIRPKLCGNCAFPQNFHTRKLGEITVFYAMICFTRVDYHEQNL